jgi:hypothetical protein
VSFAIFYIKIVQINQMHLPFRLLNASATSFKYSKVMKERTVASSALAAANEALSKLKFSPLPASCETR